ncbi:hypothetical protein RhiXN_07507 [Rhizoctonia solani]|uniref:Extracellular membrane protein CFEM domain-containing protein n=1 Tax=Rhizoctonia solani TaxID=456999 RepID=A0A8H8T2G7_9AGAM|nr:uncharacterized protein RhiXN_07507 [Rhizoctonia solani]QRW25558.1 hypothetical protein RhiXN_07507 [Rhizoctonia solani]
MSENPQPQEAPVPGLLGGQARVPQPSGQYPWRWTTITVCFCAGFILVALGLFNFAAVGYNVRSSYFDEFKDSKGVEWKNKLNIKYTGKCELESFDSSANPRYPPEDNSIHCDSSNIVLGGIYRTNNAIFALNVESLRDPVTTAPLGSANYSGDVLDSCRVNRIYMMAEYATHEVKYRAQVACRNPSTLFVNFTVDSVISIRAGVPNGIVNVDTLGRLEDEQSRPWADSRRTISARGSRHFGSFVGDQWLGDESLGRVGDPLSTAEDLPLVLSGLASADGAYIQSRDGSAFESQGVSLSVRAALRNFAVAFHSAILVDVGSTVALDKNILTNPSALQSRIQTREIKNVYDPDHGSANGLDFSVPVAPYLASSPGDFRLPIAARQSGSQAHCDADRGCAGRDHVDVYGRLGYLADWDDVPGKGTFREWKLLSVPACDTYNHARVPAVPTSPKLANTPGDRDDSMTEDHHHLDSTSTSSSTFPIASTAAPPVGGGATCVQRCLAEAANVGCIGGADLTCVCASGPYFEYSAHMLLRLECLANATPTSGHDSRTTAHAHAHTDPEAHADYHRTPAPPTTQTVILTSSVVVTDPEALLPPSLLDSPPFGPTNREARPPWSAGS